jgi:hypothetical protein
VTISNTGVTGLTGTSPVNASASTGSVTVSLASGYGDTQNPYTSKTANFVLAAPDGSAGAPTFRAVVAADIPTLNQNTTGTAANVTGTVAIANGGTGQTTANAAFNALAPSQTSNSGKYLTTNGTNTSWATVSGGSGSVTSIDVSGGTTGLTTSGGPVTTSGTVTLAGTLGVANGGTGQTTYTNGQLLIGNTTGSTLTKATLTAGTGVSVTNGTGSITLTNTGVTSNVAGTGISVSGATGAVTITNSGVTSLTAGTNISVSGSTGAVTVNATAAGSTTQLQYNNAGSLGGTSGMTWSGTALTAPLATGSTAITQAEKTASTTLATTAFVDRLRSLTTPTTTSAGGTLVVGDRGSLVSVTAGVTIPASVFAAQDVVTIYNNSAASITITQGASLTLRQVGTANTGNRTLALRGLVTVVFISATEAIISGGGLT